VVERVSARDLPEEGRTLKKKDYDRLRSKILQAKL